MAEKEKVTLKNMRCPTCGAPLKAENSKDVITCVYCENSIVPVAVETAQPSRSESASVGFGGAMKVEGIKTSSSALAYIEQFFEEYDWEAFAYAQALSVAEIDSLAKSCRSSSADDKNTWLVCFKAASVPFFNKIMGFNQVLLSVIEEYEKDSLDAYSKFDAYKRIGTKIFDSKDAIIANLEKICANAVKYGASAEEADEMRAEIENIRIISDINVYGDVEDIPEIKRFIDEKNAQIVRTLAAKGVDAQKEYQRAKKLIEEQSYVEALNVLLPLKGYSDTNELIEKIDKYYLIGDVLEIEGKLYYFKKEYTNVLSLYPAEDGKISNKPLIKSIGKIVTNYADILYYLDGEGYLKKFNLSAKAEEKIYKKKLSKENIYVYGKRAFFVEGADENQYSSEKKNIIELDLAIGIVRVVLENVKKVISFTDNKLIVTKSEKKPGKTEYAVSYNTHTEILNVDTMDIVDLGTKAIEVEGFVDNYVVYTKEAPNKNNKNLYIKNLYLDEPERLVEQNIYDFCCIISERLFYYVGNSRNRTLININWDGTDRKAWPMFISKVLFEQGGWVYFVRKAGYNSVLCKSRLDGSKFCIIAADIEEFIEIKNGYLYYINDEATLVKVRMDGSNLQELCEDVESVLSVQEDKIVFVSLDDKIKSTALEQVTATVKSVKSIYAVDFSGGGIMKLAYNVKNAKKYDENTVYFVAENDGKKTASGERKLDALYKLSFDPYIIEKLLIMEIPPEEKKDSSKYKTAMIVMGVSFFIGFIGLMAGAFGLFLLCLLVGLTALLAGLAIKANTEHKYELDKAIDMVFKPSADGKTNDIMSKINKLYKAIIKKLSD